jgi:hypothetical protein
MIRRRPGAHVAKMVDIPQRVGWFVVNPNATLKRRTVREGPREVVPMELMAAGTAAVAPR